MKKDKSVCICGKCIPEADLVCAKCHKKVGCHDAWYDPNTKGQYHFKCLPKKKG